MAVRRRQDEPLLDLPLHTLLDRLFESETPVTLHVPDSERRYRHLVEELSHRWGEPEDEVLPHWHPPPASQTAAWDFDYYVVLLMRRGRTLTLLRRRSLPVAPPT